MNLTPDILETAPPAPPKQTVAGPTPLLATWLQGQAINVTRHAAALRPFRREEFEAGVATPSEGHIHAVNHLIGALRGDLFKLTKQVGTAVEAAQSDLKTSRLQRVVARKEHAHTWVQAIERVWDFYFELFGQRQSRFGPWLVSCDRIALDCYQDVYMGLGIARSIPAPPPFAYMRTGFSPATFRRGIPLRKLGRQLNPFPLIQLPYHRLVNPWTLGAILHEVSHNLHNELDLHVVVPKLIADRLLAAGIDRKTTAAWVRWHREIFADLSGLLLGGPAVVGSLMDVIGRSPTTVTHYSPRGPHPTPVLRMYISLELLRRMGFDEQAAAYRSAWRRMYPDPGSGTLPRPLLDSFDEANRIVVETVCYQRYPSLGNKCLAEVIRFQAKEQQMIEEAARRLAAGTDPGIIPERYLIGAARVAFERRLARPGTIADHFYQELSRR